MNQGAASARATAAAAHTRPNVGRRFRGASSQYSPRIPRGSPPATLLVRIAAAAEAAKPQKAARDSSHGSAKRQYMAAVKKAVSRPSVRHILPSTCHR